MRTLFLSSFLMVSYLSAQSQDAWKPIYGMAVNQGQAQILPGPDAGNIKGLRALSFYLSLGAEKKIDTFFCFQTFIRYGIERSRLEKEYATDNFTYYHLHNSTLSFSILPGLILAQKHRLYAGINIVRVYASHAQGGGIRSSGYTYELGINNIPNSWDFRPLVHYRYYLRPEKNMALEFGVEPSFLRRKAELRKTFINSNFPTTYYKISYDLIMLSAGIVF